MNTAFFQKKFNKTKRGERNVNRKRTGEVIFYWSILAIPLIQFVLMYVAVNINSFILAFKDYTYDMQTGRIVTDWVGFAHFKTFFVSIFSEEQMGRRFLFSLMSYGIHLVFGTVVTLFFSYYIYKRFFATKFFRVTLMIPTVISSIVIVMMYNYATECILPSLLGCKPLLTSGTRMQTFLVVVFGNIFFGFGAGMLMYSNAMSRIPDSLIEYASLEGCSPIKEFIYIVLPLIYPTLETFFITGLANLFVNQENLFGFFSTNSEVQTVGYFLYMQVFGQATTMASYPFAAASGLALTFITIPIVMLAKRLFEKFDPGVEF